MRSLLIVSRRPAPGRRLSGFTLVELLVVMGIIAILAGVTLGPLLQARSVAKHSVAMQSAHAIGIAMDAFANDNQDTFPDGGSPGVPAGNSGGTTAAAAVQPLIAGGYVPDPSIFYISGSAATKYTGGAASAATAIQAGNISWDFAGNSGTGLSSDKYQYLPLLWSSAAMGTEPSLSSASAPNTAVICSPGVTDAFGTSGIAVFYINNSAQFLTSSIVGGTPAVTIIQATDNSGGSPTTAKVLPGGG